MADQDSKIRLDEFKDEALNTLRHVEKSVHVEPLKIQKIRQAETPQSLMEAINDVIPDIKDIVAAKYYGDLGILAGMIKAHYHLP